MVRSMAVPVPKPVRRMNALARFLKAKSKDPDSCGVVCALFIDNILYVSAGDHSQLDLSCLDYLATRSIRVGQKVFSNEDKVELQEKMKKSSRLPDIFPSEQTDSMDPNKFSIFTTTRQQRDELKLSDWWDPTSVAAVSVLPTPTQGVHAEVTLVTALCDALLQARQDLYLGSSYAPCCKCFALISCYNDLANLSILKGSIPALLFTSQYHLSWPNDWKLPILPNQSRSESKLILNASNRVKSIDKTKFSLRIFMEESLSDSDED